MNAVRAMITVLLSVLLTTPAAAQASPTGFVALKDVDPTILSDMRYYTAHNFVGRRIDGYEAPLCIVTRPTALALRKVQREMLARGYTLKVYDCYRPQRAVNHFVRWARDLADQRMKPEFYPRVDKTRLFEDGYIAEKSGHSRGSTIDLTIVRLPVRYQRPYVPGERLVDCAAPNRFPDNTVDMATGYDCFDTLSHTDDPRVTGKARENRQLLKKAMADNGFRNLPEEWWHFTLNGEPFPDTYFDFPVWRRSL
jgi:zinc D-Ala-D-Ala dipeptidase